MEADVMSLTTTHWRRRTREAGFSMVEMLVAAFIMAIGILGLTMLQTYAIRAQTESRSTEQAVMIGMRVLDQAEMLGRNSIYCSRIQVSPPALNPNYFGAASFNQYYDASGAPVAGSGFYTVVVTPSAAGSGLVAPVTGIGGLAMVTVTVSWKEPIAGVNQTTDRRITLNRRINYATS
jgi:Tfp pilus assembly protein PilV